MVYSNKFVLAVLVNGEPQKELANGTVPVPFGCEYAIRMRNKNDRRAVAKIYIDGENVSGNGYIIPANEHVDIKRHSSVDRAFKFVALDSAEAVDFGKNGPNPDKIKGVVEVRFQLEKEQKPVEHHHHHHHHDYWYRPPLRRPMYEPTWTLNNSPLRRTSSREGYETMKGISPTSFNMNTNLSLASMDGLERTAISDMKDGCTVEGNTTGQSFTSSYVDIEDTVTTLKVFLQGYESGSPVQVSTKRPTNKDKHLSDLEAENEELRKKLAEAENDKLKDELKKKTAKKPRKKKA